MKETDLFVGIDFSLNSPSITIKYKKEKNEYYKFCSFFNSNNKDWKNKNIKAYYNHKNLLNTDIFLIEYVRNISSEEYTEKESQKIEDAEKLSKLICNFILSFIKDNNLNITDIKIAIEGFSYGSTGAAYNDLIMYNSFLRKELLNLTSSDNIYVFSPKHAKKLAGNGNANKEYMIDAFRLNKLNDKLIINTDLFKYCSDSLDIKNLKPVDDLIDSYFILNCLINRLCL